MQTQTSTELLRQIEHLGDGCITSQFTNPAVAADLLPIPSDVDPRLASALKARGISELYSHQLEAWHLAVSKKNAVIVTPTASGKTLCYNLPVMQAAMTRRAKALYLFPTKALSQDQVAEILEMNEAANLDLRAYTFDGDTPSDARVAVRTKGDIVVTNPDMLHVGILPHHTKWAQFFESLEYIVIDELHTYRGVFGSHMANVLRRLNRVCEFYQARPTFLMSSATIANPKQLAEKLIGQPVSAITQSGAPKGATHVYLWNPPVVNPALGIRKSSRSQVTLLAKLFTRAGLKSIVFANTRLAVEVITKYLKDAFDADPRKPNKVFAYRGGYLPTERRTTEKLMRAGEIDCIVATSALELGVDIGSLDACVLNGYPGTIASTWQRIGRAGRRNQDAIGVLVATSDPLDQFIVRNPSFFTQASPEHAQIGPNQELILTEHIKCAAFELPFESSETFGDVELLPTLRFLEGEGVLQREGEIWHWSNDSYPANSVSLRSVADGNFVVIDTTDGKKNVIAEVDYSSAPMTIYEGAIYMVQAQPWQVERLDWEGRKAFVRKTEADYYTDAIDYTKLKVMDEFEVAPCRSGGATTGEVHLVRHIPGYKKIRYYTHENVGYGNIKVPDQEIHTTAVWWRVNPTDLEQEFETRWQALDGFLGAGYAIHSIATLLTMSERRDLGHAIGDSSATWSATIGLNGNAQAHGHDGQRIDLSNKSLPFNPTIFVYDNYPGGIGLSQPLFEMQARAITAAIDLVKGCDCTLGCPACVGPILAVEQSGQSSPKQSALKVLRLLTSG